MSEHPAEANADIQNLLFFPMLRSKKFGEDRGNLQPTSKSFVSWRRVFKNHSFLHVNWDALKCFFADMQMSSWSLNQFKKSKGVIGKAREAKKAPYLGHISAHHLSTKPLSDTVILTVIRAWVLYCTYSITRDWELKSMSIILGNTFVLG